MFEKKRVIPKNQRDLKMVLIHKFEQFIERLPSVFLIFFIIMVFVFLYNIGAFSVKAQIISKHKFIDNKLILKEITPLLSLPLDLVKIKENIIENAWVKSVEIKRVWYSLKIKIIPQKIVFNWHNFENTKNGYIGESGELFIPNNIALNNKITIISDAKNIKNAFVNLSKYQQVFTAKIDKFIKTNIETFVLKSGAKIIIGQQNQVLRLQKLAKHYHNFKMRPTTIVDLRYSNGFAKFN